MLVFHSSSRLGQENTTLHLKNHRLLIPDLLRLDNGCRLLKHLKPVGRVQGIVSHWKFGIISITFCTVVDKSSCSGLDLGVGLKAGL